MNKITVCFCLIIFLCISLMADESVSISCKNQNMIAYQVFIRVSKLAGNSFAWELFQYVAKEGTTKMEALPKKELILSAKEGFYTIEAGDGKCRRRVTFIAPSTGKIINTASEEGVYLSVENADKSLNEVKCSMLYLRNIDDLPIMVSYVGNLESGKPKEVFSYFTELEGRKLLLKEPKISNTELQVNPSTKAVLSESGLIPFRKGDKWGFCDKNKKLVMPCEYPMVIMVSPSISLIVDNSAFGVISPFGEIIYPVGQCDGWSMVTRNAGIFLQIKKDDGTAVILDQKTATNYLNQTMIRLPRPSKHVSIGFDCPVPDKSNSDSLEAFQKSDKWGLRNLKGEIIIPAAYSILGKASCGRINAYDGGKWGYFDLEGKIIIPFKYSLACPFINGLALVKDSKSEEWGYIDVNGVEYWQDDF